MGMRIGMGGMGNLSPQATKLSGRNTRRSIVGRTSRLFTRYKGLLVLIFAAIVFTATLGVVNPLMIKWIFDNALFCGRGCPNLGNLYFGVGVMIAVPCITSVVGIGQTYVTNQVGQHVMEDLRNSLYAHLQGMSLRFFTGTRTGEIQSRLTNDVGGIQTVVTDTASTILSNVVILVSTVAAMAFLSWQLTVLSLGLVPFFIYLTYRAGRARRLIAMKTQESRAEMSAITEETLSISGILLAKVFGRAEAEKQRFADENRRLAQLAVRQEMIGRSLFAVVGTFFSIAPALVYLVGGLVMAGGHTATTLTGGVTPGTIVAFTTLQSRLFFPIGQMLQVSVEIQASLALFERIFDYLDMPHDITNRPGATPLDPGTTRGEVTLDHVWFRYDRPTDPGAPVAAEASDTPLDTHAVHVTRDWALEDVTFTVRPGQLAAIVGPSGAGKTTISYIVPRLYDVTEGRMLIDGTDVRDVTLDSISDVVAMVTQDTYLFHASVRRNLLYAKPDATQDELEAAARAAFIHDRIMQLRDGYDTLVGERGYRMSGGEKQRLAIARVALKAPRILILDEATSALDTTSERLVQAALAPLMSGRTTIAIAHRLSTILAADVIFVVDGGRIIEQGTHMELIAQGGMYAQLYEQQFQSGRVEAVCEDGMILADGEVIAQAEEQVS